jgi:hypothetical protein
MQSPPYKQLSQDALAGLIAGLLFVVVASVSVLIYLPAFMLLLCGLSNGHRRMSVACGCGCIVAGLALGIPGLLFFAVTIALPAGYFVRYALLWRESEEGVQWYPAERIIAYLTLLAASFFMASALVVAGSGTESLQSRLGHELAGTVPPGPPEFVLYAHQFINDYSFLILATFCWVWVLLFYGLAVAANRLLNAYHRALRPSLALSWRGLPVWLLGLLSITALLALFGTGNDRYCAHTLFLVLLLPYFLVGLARIHAYTLGRSYRNLWLTLLYMLTFLLIWPAAAVILLGIYSNIAEMLDKPPKIG